MRQHLTFCAEALGITKARTSRRIAEIREAVKRGDCDSAEAILDLWDADSTLWAKQFLVQIGMPPDPQTRPKNLAHVAHWIEASYEPKALPDSVPVSPVHEDTDRLRLYFEALRGKPESSSISKQIFTRRMHLHFDAGEKGIARLKEWLPRGTRIPKSMTDALQAQMPVLPHTRTPKKFVVDPSSLDRTTIERGLEVVRAKIQIGEKRLKEKRLEDPDESEDVDLLELKVEESELELKLLILIEASEE